MTRSADTGTGSAPEREATLVVLELGFVGDSIMTLPTLRALRREHPRARIVRVINAAMGGFWDGCPDCDDIVPFDRRRPKLRAGRELLASVRALRPDALLNLHTPDRDRPARFYWRDAVFARLSGAARRLAWSHGPDALLLTDPVPRRLFGDANMALEMFRVAEPIAAEPALRDATFWHEARHRDEAGAQLALAPWSDGAASPFLALSPFGKDAAKELPAAELAAIARRCHEATGLPLVLLGGPADREKVAPVLAALGAVGLGEVVLDLVGRNDLKVAAALLERARVVLAVDSGLMHLGALVGAPTVGLFGLHPPHRWRPFRDERLATFVGRTAGEAMPALGTAGAAPFDAEAIAAAVARGATDRRDAEG